MVVINLLPWRAQRKQYEANMVKYLLLLSLGLLLVILGGVYVYALILQHQTQQQLEQAQIDLKQFVHLRVDKQARQNIAAPTLEGIAELRKATAKWWMAFAESYAEHVCFVSMRRDKNDITFTGEARSLADLTKFLLRWRAGTLFSEISIDKLQRQANGIISFRLHAKLVVL